MPNQRLDFTVKTPVEAVKVYGHRKSALSVRYTGEKYMKKIITIVSLLLLFLSPFSRGEALTADELATAQGISWFNINIPSDAPTNSTLRLYYTNDGKIVDRTSLFLRAEPNAQIKLFILDKNGSNIRVSAIKNKPYKERSERVIKNRFKKFFTTSFVVNLNSGSTVVLDKPIALLSSTSQSKKKITLYLELTEK